MSGATDATLARGHRATDYLELTKPKLSLLVLTTTLAGFLLAPAPSSTLWPLVWTLLGTILVVGGANALNQVYEREVDALMRRTAGRPLPAGRLWARPAGAFGIAIAAVGVAMLWRGTNPLAAGLAGAGFVLYVFVYTPLKRLSRWSTLVGAVPGAIPPMIGWAAASGRIDAVGAALFGVLVAWQMPHFLAIGRLFREDYQRAGMRMLGVGRGDGPVAYRHMIGWCLVLIPVSATLTLLEATGTFYLVGAVALGAGFLVMAVRAARRRSPAGDRGAFFYSLIYLPALLLLMVLDKLAA